jgi:5-methylcytosine-specific restriction endonuclease McrA
MANFTEEEIQQVWEKGTVVEGYDKNKYRKDVCEAWMDRDKYGEEVTLGWEIDHVYPSSKGGKNDLKNLRPMQWENNRSKADNYPGYSCAVTSKDNQNIQKAINKTVNDSLQADLKIKYKIK